MTLITIRQPGYMPNITFFKKILTSDIFVYFDDAQYAIRSWDNRNKIKTPNGSMWLTVPVSDYYLKNLNEVCISNSTNWQKKHLAAIKSSYGKSPFFKNYWSDLESILNRKWEKLIELNFAIINFINSELKINTKTICSSELNVDGKSSEKLLNICKKLNGTIYRSGPMSKNYLDENIFNQSGIKIEYENFDNSPYTQINGEFLPNMSIIDLLFNEGPNSKKFLNDTT